MKNIINYLKNLQNFTLPIVFMQIFSLYDWTREVNMHIWWLNISAVLLFDFMGKRINGCSLKNGFWRNWMNEQVFLIYWYVLILFTGNTWSKFQPTLKWMDLWLDEVTEGGHYGIEDCHLWPCWITLRILIILLKRENVYWTRVHLKYVVLKIEPSGDNCCTHDTYRDLEMMKTRIIKNLKKDIFVFLQVHVM